MGIELIIGGLTAITSIIGGIAQANAIGQQANAMKEAAAQEREARNIQTAQQQSAGMESRRQRIREERIRRAQIIAASENQGVGDASGVIGATGALSTNLSGLIGQSIGESKANTAVSNKLQAAADFTAQGNLFAAKGQATAATFNAIGAGLKGFQSIFQK